jgi:hypothetical protein
MKGKVPRDRPTRFSAQEPAKPPDGRVAGGFAPAHSGSAEEREVIVSRLRRFSPWLVTVAVVVAAAPLAPAGAQNLDAGKSASQIFSEVCANCHRSARELKSSAGASFLREHYTTGSEMASTMAAYLAGAGSSDPRAPGAGPQPKRPPNPTGGPAVGATPPGTPPATTTSRDAPAPDTAARDPRRAQQTPDPKTSDPKTSDPKTSDPKTSDPKTAGPPGSPKGRPARAEGPAEAKPVASAPPVPARPALEEFEE